MPRLITFTMVSLDGFICDAKGDMSWAHRQDAEWKAFSAENAKGDSTLLFGRTTYEMMASFWPSAMARQSAPETAATMNSHLKVVFSRTLREATWNNTRLASGDLATEVRKLKATPGPGLVVLGSGSIVAQLAMEGLVDEFQLAVIPVVIGSGKALFAGVSRKLNLKTIKTRAFANGNVLLRYEPAG
jgi:dihydrofolate reductase